MARHTSNSAGRRVYARRFSEEGDLPFGIPNCSQKKGDISHAQQKGSAVSRSLFRTEYNLAEEQNAVGHRC
jgi:hypothetical protein